MKNYTVRFALSMIVIILPILTIIHGIILFIHTLKQEFSMNVLGKELLVLGISLILVFFILLGIGYYLYKKTNYEIKEEVIIDDKRGNISFSGNYLKGFNYRKQNQYDILPKCEVVIENKKTNVLKFGSKSKTKK